MYLAGPQWSGVDMRAAVLALVLVATPSVAAALQAASADRTYEGEWYLSDTTDNNTGEREVYAFVHHLKADDPNYVTVKLRCLQGKPTLSVEWDNLTFPDQQVITIGYYSSSGKTSVKPYVFEKSADAVERGLRTSLEISREIVSSIGQATYLTLAAHLPAGTQTVGLDVAGTPKAWSRVSRHCPVRTLPLPPL